MLGKLSVQKLDVLGRTHRVICVTHLPQVAAYTKHQWTIRKATSARRTTTTITPLRTDDERLEELATMLRREARSDTTRREAGEMLKAAKKKW
jgi:DNA repair protein RecN (Recombination protein N)